MASTYPTTQDTFTTKVQGGVISEDHINDLQNAVIAVEANIGTTNSAVTTTIDYKLKNASSVNPGHKHTLAGALTDVEITSPTDGQGIVYDSASGKFKNATTSVPKATNLVSGIAKLSAVSLTPTDPVVVETLDPRVPTQNENDALVGTSGTAVSSSNKLVDAADVSSAGASGKIVRLSGTSYPAGDGSAITNAVSFKNGTASKDASDASATQNIAHGLGKTPKYVKITYLNTVTATSTSTVFDGGFSVYNGTTQSSVSTYGVSGGNRAYNIAGTTIKLQSYNNLADSTTGVITFDSTNVIITWTKNGANANGIFTLLWEAYA